MSARPTNRSAPAWVALIFLWAAVALPACGGDGSESETPAASELGPPGANQPIDRAENELVAALDSGDCKRILGLNPIQREGFDTNARCKQLLMAAKGAETTRAAAYEGGGAVVDLNGPGVHSSALLVVDLDGHYHLTYIDRSRSAPSVGSKPAPEFDDAARRAVEALGDRDCDAFLGVANRRYGPGSAPHASAACVYAENNPVANILQAFPEAKLEPGGGNKSYAFYGFGTPNVHYTIIMARQSNANLPAGVAKLPEGAAEYSFVDAFQTRAKQPTDETK